MEDYKTEKEFCTDNLCCRFYPVNLVGSYEKEELYKFLSKFKQHLIDTGEMVPPDRWVSVNDRLPEPLQRCNFIVDHECSHYHNKCYGGVYTGDIKSEWRSNEFSTPGVAFFASYWQSSPLPPAPGEHNTKSVKIHRTLDVDGSDRNYNDDQTH